MDRKKEHIPGAGADAAARGVKVSQDQEKNFLDGFAFDSKNGLEMNNLKKGYANSLKNSGGSMGAGGRFAGRRFRGFIREYLGKNVRISCGNAIIWVLKGRAEGPDPATAPCEGWPSPKECLMMTVIFVFVALIAANIAYSVYDSYREEDARQIDDFYRVEFKKSYDVKKETESAMNPII